MSESRVYKNLQTSAIILEISDSNLESGYPGYQRFFSRAAGIFGVGRRPTHLRHYKELTETGNRARKVSGTQGRVREIRSKICSLPDYLGELTALYFDPKIFIGWILFRTMPPGNLANLILVAIVMSERQTSPRWGWIIHSLTRQVSFRHTVFSDSPTMHYKHRQPNIQSLQCRCSWTNNIIVGSLKVL